jgi:hypothetical protein
LFDHAEVSPNENFIINTQFLLLGELGWRYASSRQFARNNKRVNGE